MRAGACFAGFYVRREGVPKREGKRAEVGGEVRTETCPLLGCGMMGSRVSAAGRVRVNVLPWHSASHALRRRWDTKMMQKADRYRGGVCQEF